MSKKKLSFRVAHSLAATSIVFAVACDDKTYEPPPADFTDEVGQQWWVHPDKTKRTYPPARPEDPEKSQKSSNASESVLSNPVAF